MFTPRPRRRSPRRPLRLEQLEDRTTPTLTLSLSPGGFAEAAGPAAATGTVTRTGDTTDPLTVSLTSDDPSEAAVPATVTIPAGQAFATFPITAVNDAALDGHQPVRITAAVLAPGTTWTGPDPTFGAGGFRMVSVWKKANTNLPDVALLPDGRIAAVGGSFWSGGTWALTRVTADGTTKVRRHHQHHRPEFHRRVRQRRGRPAGRQGPRGRHRLSGGTNHDDDDWGVARYLANGNPDTTFGTNGVLPQGVRLDQRVLGRGPRHRRAAGREDPARREPQQLPRSGSAWPG